jgi:hypothetical protein
MYHIESFVDRRAAKASANRRKNHIFNDGLSF